MDIDNLKRRLSRLEGQMDILLQEHEGKETQFTYWGGHTMGYLKGKISVLEEVISELESHVFSNNL